MLGTIAAAEALVILVAGIVLLAKPFAHHLRSAAQHRSASQSGLAGRTGPDTPAGKPRLTPAQTFVAVLNGNGRPGAAAAAAATLHRFGYRIGSVGNATRMDYPTSVVMYKRGYRSDAIRLARRARAHVVGPLDGVRPKDLGRADVVYVVGTS